MLKLYELEKEYTQALELMEQWAIEHEGDLTDFPLFQELEKLTADRTTKCLNIGCLIKNLNAEAEAFATEARTLATRKKTLENKANRLRDYLLTALQPGERIEDARCRLSWRKSSSVEITCPVESLPAEYIKVEESPKKAELAKALKVGATIDGVTLVESLNLQIG